MKIPATLVILSLANCCFYSGAEHSTWKDECSVYVKPLHGCTEEYDPVCGTDGVTYGNKCMLCLERQETCQHIGIKHKGECKDICSKFPEPKKGESDACTLEYDPICGSDGVTYSNRCHFCIARWKSGGTLTVRHVGKCIEEVICRSFPPPKKNEPVVCTMEYDPICGSDGKTHGNKCLFCAARWKSGGTLTIRYKSECKEEVLCSDYPVPEKGEPVVCTKEYYPICGCDCVTYHNKCLFCAAWRKSGGIITIHYEGECKKKGKHK